MRAAARSSSSPGPSGGGKSTLLNIIAGLDKDFEGKIDLGGAGDTALAFVFQSPRLLPWRTVYENIALALPEGDPRLANIPELLERVGLTEAANAYPEMISLGMQRRAALARGFVLEPELLLMDEPFVSLDDPTAQGLRELLVELWSRAADDGAVRDPRPGRGGDARHPHLAPVGRLCNYRPGRPGAALRRRPAGPREGADRAAAHLRRSVELSQNAMEQTRADRRACSPA